MKIGSVAYLPLALVLSVWAPAGPAVAHTRSASYSSWELRDDGARVRLRIPLLELTRLPPELLGSGSDAIAHYLEARLWLTSGDQRCPRAASPERLGAPEGWALFEWRIRCETRGARGIESSILLEVAPSHLHFARLRAGPGGVRERVLTRADPRWPLEGAGAGPDRRAPAGTALTGYIGLGIEHILTGWDHLAFVIALLLLAGRLGELAGIVTSFTIAHSVTLGLAVVGVVHPDRAGVEALIGYSIALVAAENVWLLAGRGSGLPRVASAGVGILAGLALLGVGAVPPLALLGTALFTFCHFELLRRAERPARLRSAVAFGFGLVHGFGFAGILAELELSPERLAPALFGFNAGVELGQLAVVLSTWPLLRLLTRWKQGHPYRLACEAGSAAICGLGLFWFAVRTFG